VNEFSRDKRWDGPGLDAWEPWSPRRVASILTDVDVRWAIVGGHAIDLWLGKSTREHDDLEIAIPRSEFRTVCEHLDDFDLHAVGDGEVTKFLVGQAPMGDKHQCWVLDRVANSWRRDIMLEPGDRETWVFRRDARVQAPRSRMIRYRDDIPFLVPEGVLLYKAKASRPKDEADFAACLPTLEFGARYWLSEALELLYPGHLWADHLSGEHR
jgi:hypothetical protein